MFPPCEPKAIPPKYTKLEVRLWSRIEVNESSSCWEWQGPVNRKGYGSINGHYPRREFVHRLSWMWSKGEIPTDLCVLHKCDNPRCVNPEHLFLGSLIDNALDRDRKGRCQHGETHYISKLTENQVREIRRLRGLGILYSTLVRKFKVSMSTIEDILMGRTWKHVS